MISNSEIIYYDIIQILKHLLSIYKYSIKNKITVNINLDNVCWNITEPFLMYLKTKEERTLFINIRDKHHEEATKCISILNNFIKNVLHIDTISVQLIYYDDLLKRLILVLHSLHYLNDTF